ncbi:hypothetical protein TD95_004780 [Thielaviopsis punctulata]|uniref:Uncharacterized protein n=1 Tax=Thielaviopsis punctulata TaxID=72032 RepID=A0A0F4ZI78_9PEZI|nr:hypothetical protein TD95_004780 [Thielaviopsis punctulata]
MQRQEILTPVTPPPDNHAFNSTTKTKNKPAAFSPYDSTFPYRSAIPCTPTVTMTTSPANPTMSTSRPSLKRKASTELCGLSAPPQPKPQMTPLPPKMPASGVPRTPIAAFAAMGMIPSTATVNPAGAFSQSNNSTSSASSSSATAAATAATSATSPLLSSSSTAAAAAAAAATAAGPVPMSVPMPMPTTPMMAGFPPDMDSAKYTTMVSRIASYYQQRCQAIANYQHQKCQAWATVQRQKCQETMQAAMLVVAWYVRDRIQRRRRKQKRRFRTALKTLGMQRAAATAKTGRGEAVGRWVLDVADEPLSPNAVSMDKVRDQDEEAFNIDADVPLDRDGKLLEVADNLIRSQYRKLDVPLLGLLSFDESSGESDSESESESESENEMGDEQEEIEYDDEDEEDDDDELEEELELELERATGKLEQAIPA